MRVPSVLALGLLAACSLGGRPSGGTGATGRAAPSDCGLDDPTLPDFELVDENPASPTEGVAYASADFLGRVLVIYWAVAT